MSNNLGKLFFVFSFLFLTFVTNIFAANYNPTDSVQSFVTRFYNECLNREPDQGGLNGWVDALKNGWVNGSDLAEGFIFSPEFINRGISDEEFLTILYRAFFNRQPDSVGFNGWLSALQSGTSRSSVLEGFVYSDEFSRLCSQYGITPYPLDLVEAFVTRFYNECLNREPDQAGLDGWVNGLKNGWVTGGGIAESFILSPEYANMGTSDEEFLETLYQAFFNRQPDSVGFNGWLLALRNGMSRSAVLEGFISSDEFFKLCSDYGIKILSDDNGDNTPNVVHDQSLSFRAIGTYSYYDNTLSAFFTESDFPSDEGPPVNINLSLEIIQLTDSTLMFEDENGEILTWHREQGQAGDITGTWTMDKTHLMLNSDGTTILTETSGSIFNVPFGTITIDGNFNDWLPQHIAYADTDGPDCGNAPGLDLKEVYLAEDGTFIYLRFVLNGPPNATYGYMLGNNERHIRVRSDGVNGYISYSSGTGLPVINLPNNFVYIQGNQFECKFYKSDVASDWPVDDSLGAWLDQGFQTDCRDYVELPFLRFN